MNKVKLIGIIAIVAIISLTLMSCGKKGGTFTITNDSGGIIYAAASTDLSDLTLKVTNAQKNIGITETDLILNGRSKNWPITEDGEVHYFWIGYDSLYTATGPIQKITIEQGKTETITAK